MPFFWNFFFSFGVLWLPVIAFCAWMFIDCLSHDITDKVFWAILILGTGPVGAVIYALERSKLTGEVSYHPAADQRLPGSSGTAGAAADQNAPNVPSTPAAGLGVPPPSMSKSSQVIRGVGATLGVIMAVGGLLFVGFFILVMVSLSSLGSSK